MTAVIPALNRETTPQAHTSLPRLAEGHGAFLFNAAAAFSKLSSPSGHNQSLFLNRPNHTMLILNNNPL
jgi:hypothetical protein